jgi:NADH-quinone oxidoreductase subunit A
MVRVRPHSLCYDFAHTLQKMPIEYIPIAIFALLAAAFPAVSFLALKQVRLHLQIPDRETGPVEGETSPEGTAHSGYAPRFPVIAMLFVIFAAVIVFLFPWSIKCSQMGWYGLIIATVFVGIFLAGYGWLYQMGVLDGI